MHQSVSLLFAGVLSSAALLGCSSDPPITPDPTGGGTPDAGEPADHVEGSRLKARWIAAGDGSRERVGWTDTERGEACTFRTAADGVLRCLPEAMRVEVPGIGSHYTDAACTKPTAAIPVECNPVTYVSHPTACGGEVIRRIEGAPLTDVFVSGGGGACVAYAWPSGTSSLHATVEVEAGAFQDAAPEP